MKNISNNRILVIPDIHQCLDFADRALKAEPFDHVVFLGDYFDCFETPDNQKYFSVAKTCEWLNEKYDELGDKATWLVGNHDLSYLGTYRPNTYEIHRPQGFCICSGWTKNKASEFNKKISPAWIEALELCAEGNGYVFSHAGFHYQQLEDPTSSVRDNIIRLAREWRENRFEFREHGFHWTTECGACRGGMGTIGSPLWLDWDNEFVPMEEIRQIVGHTNGRDVRTKNLTQTKVDYCLDAYRTTYAIVTENGVKTRYVGN